MGNFLIELKEMATECSQCPCYYSMYFGDYCNLCGEISGLKK